MITLVLLLLTAALGLTTAIALSLMRRVTRLERLLVVCAPNPLIDKHLVLERLRQQNHPPGGQPA